MPAGQTRNLRERLVHALRVEGAASFEETILVAEGAMVRTAARDHNRIGYQIPVPLDQIPPYRRHAFQRAQRRLVAGLRGAGGKIAQKLRKGVLSGPEKNRVCVRSRFNSERWGEKDTKSDESSTGPTPIRDGIRAIRVCDVDLNDDEVRLIVKVQ